VIVYKITVENTVEERILNLQERKRQLAEHTIEGSMKKEGFKLGVQEMLDLFKHVGHSDGNDEDDGVAFGASQDLPDSLASMRAKPKPRKDHEVFGRRW
jgi:hypothetical protein